MNQYAFFGYMAGVPAACLDEAQALAFAAGALTEQVRAPVEEHIDDCDSCRRVLAALVKRGASRDWAAGTQIGRYTVGARIGRGGMGAVWRADDRELGRAVALKRVHASADGEQRARLVREARAAALLQHPNVVAVYEVGEYEGEPFLAMELVDGVTLAAWLRGEHSVREIVGVLAQAGRGLAAAHASGLVHRDFKPDNVLVDRDSASPRDAARPGKSGTFDCSVRARVADFGLARAGKAHAGDKLPAAGALGKLTETGTLSGTPAYMAPELVEGAPPDARSDQYAFAITAFEALYGRHPFVGDTVEAKWIEMAAGRIVEVRGRRVPKRLDHAVRRALAVDPRDRWPSVAAFVAELERAPRRAWPWLAGFGVFVAANAAVFAYTRAPGNDCERGTSLVDDVWSAAARLDHARAFAAVAPGRAIEIAAADRLVDDWADAWRLGRRAACRAEPAQRDARLACLDRALGDLRAQLAAWQEPDAKVVDRALGAIAGLPAPADCIDHAPPAGNVSPVLEARVAQLAALDHAGAERKAEAGVPKLLADAEATGDPGVLARALVAAAMNERDLGDHVQARDHASRAAREAARAGDDVTMLDALLDEAAVAADAEHPSEALGLCDAADALIARGKLDREPRALVARADALVQLGRGPEAITAYQRAIAILEPRAARDRRARLQLSAALGALGGAYAQEQRPDDARATIERSLAIEEPELGPDHPEIGRSLHDLGLQELELGHDADGVAHLMRARDILSRAYGEHAPLVAMCDISLADHARVTGACKQAMPMYEHAGAALGPDEPAQASIEYGLGVCAHDLDDLHGAVDHLQRALAIYAREGRTGGDIADLRTELGLTLVALGRDGDARTQAEQALADFERANVEPKARIDAWRVLAEVEHDAGHTQRALELQRQVLATIGDDPRPQFADVRKAIEAELADWSKK